MSADSQADGFKLDDPLVIVHSVDDEAGEVELVYLGDAVYIEWQHDRQMFRMFTTDGLMKTNSIYLEPEVFENLRRYVDQYSRPR